MKDFFISRNGKDKAWAEWIASTLVDAGYSIVIQDWDFRPGGNFVLDMDRAIKGTEKTIVVLSDNFLNAEFTQPEWAAAFRQDPQGIKRALIPVKVRDCKPSGLLSQISYINFVNLADESECRTALLDGLREPGPPEQELKFPGTTQNQQSTNSRVPFPGDLWNVPYDRNNFFTGREQILTDLHQRLTQESTAAPSQTQAISGLGGIGKTQTAVEYAYRYAQDYQAVFWVRAETRTEIITEFVEIARRLELPQADDQDPMDAANAVKRWLGSETDWLLVFDNADTPKLIKEFRPQRFNGHILLTSRAQHFDILGIAKPVSLNKMQIAEARAFLLKRTGKDESISSEELAAIDELAKELDYFPLALEQAGAYILQQEVQVSDYLASFAQRQLKLLEQSTPVTGKYSASVATTWALNFEQVSVESKVSADILRASAFFSPDAIPYELLLDGANELEESIAEALPEGSAELLRLSEFLTPLTRYSLIRRESASRTYSIHRLVQEALKQSMEPDEYLTWVERVVCAVAKVFPDADFENWQQCDRLLPQAQAAAKSVIDLELKFTSAALLLEKVGYYFDSHGQYLKAEPLYLAAWDLRKELLGDKHPDVATSLHKLAGLYYWKGLYEDAENYYLQALNLRKELLGNKDPAVAQTLNNLAYLFYKQGREKEAESYFLQSLELRRDHFGEKDPSVAQTLNNLATLYESQKRYEEAEPLYRQVLELRKEFFGEKHMYIAIGLRNLASTYQSKGHFEEAESLYLQALRIIQELLGEKKHPFLAIFFNKLASLYQSQDNYEKAEIYYIQALTLRKELLGEKHPDVATSLNNLAGLYESQGRYEQATSLYLQALEILDEVLGNQHPTTVSVRHYFELFKSNRDKS